MTRALGRGPQNTWAAHGGAVAVLPTQGLKWHGSDTSLAERLRNVVDGLSLIQWSSMGWGGAGPPDGPDHWTPELICSKIPVS